MSARAARRKELGGPFGVALSLHAVALAGLWHWAPGSTPQPAPSTVEVLRAADTPPAAPPAEAPAPVAAAATSASATQVAPVTAAATPATHSESQTQSYASQLRALIERGVRYPLGLRRRGVQGTLELKLTLDAAGRATEIELARSSGSDELDHLALQAVHDTQPFPAPPASPLSVRLPIEFRLTAD